MKVLDCWTTRLLQFTKPGISDYGCARLWESSIFYRGLSQSEFATIGRNFFKVEIRNFRSHIWTYWLKICRRQMRVADYECGRIWKRANVTIFERCNFRLSICPFVRVIDFLSGTLTIGTPNNRALIEVPIPSVTEWQLRRSKCEGVPSSTFRSKATAPFPRCLTPFYLTQYYILRQLKTINYC